MLAGAAGDGLIVQHGAGEERVVIDAVLIEELAQVAILRAVNPMLVETIVELGLAAGVRPVAGDQLAQEVGVESWHGQFEGAEFKRFPHVDVVEHFRLAVRSHTPTATREMLDEAFAGKAVEDAAQDGAAFTGAA